MKFLYSHRTRARDGQRVHIDALTDALAERGHEIFVAAPGAARAPANLAAKSESWARRALPTALYECAECGYSVPAFYRLTGMIRRDEPDIIYERYNLFYHAGVWASRRSGLPLILEVNAPLAEERARHGGLFWKRWARQSEEAIWRAADIVTPVSQSLADHVRAAGVTEERIRVIPNGVDDQFLRAADSEAAKARFGLAGKLVVGFSGFLRDWHRVDRAIEWLAASSREDAALLIVGDGPARADLEALARRLGVAGDCVFTGVVQRAEMPGALEAFDIALQPAATGYASPLKLFEYMAMGKAILAPRAANIEEILSNAATAMLFDEASAGGFAKALTTLAGDAELRTRLGAAAREELLRRDYTWRANAGRVEAIAMELLEDRA